MKISRIHFPDMVLGGGLALLVVLLFVSAGLFRDARANREKTHRYLDLYASVQEEREQLSRYESEKRRLAAIPEEKFTEKNAREILPGNVRAPDVHSFRKQEAVDGFEGLQVDWQWKSLDKKEAFRILSVFQESENKVWRISNMKLEALPDGENVSLRLLLESAKPVGKDFQG